MHKTLREMGTKNLDMTLIRRRRDVLRHHRFEYGAKNCQLVSTDDRFAAPIRRSFAHSIFNPSLANWESFGGKR